MPRLETQLLAIAARLMLEYNESTGKIYRTISATARALGIAKCALSVSYGEVVVGLDNDSPLLMRVEELRYNAALLARVHSILNDVRSRKLDPSAALANLQQAEAETPRLPGWLTVLLLGLAAASLAALMGADGGAILVAGVTTSLGLVARKELGRRKWSLLTLPLVAGFLGAALGGLAIRLGWTATPALALIVPSLMLVPGPHLINGLLDLIDNYMLMSLARLALASSILIAVALGILLGIELTLPNPPAVAESINTDHLNLAIDMLLAGVVAVGFAAFYNTAPGHLAFATAGGIAGHGCRFLALEMGCGMIMATFLGGMAVGAVSAWVVRSYKVPFAVMAFAGAVTMMPGLQMYRAISGFLKLARMQEAEMIPPLESTLAYAFQSCLVVIALSIGLVFASRAIQQLPEKRTSTA
jgi:uncharacterized membrane protein YjjP (DUF1212 family)